MRKFLAVTKREYKKVVFTWTFLIGTLLAPLLASLFAIVPMIIFSIKGDAVRLAIVDSTGKVSARLKENLSPEKILEKAQQATKDSFKNMDASQEERLKQRATQVGENFIFEEYKPEGKQLEQVRRELNERINQGSLDAYLIVPENFDLADTKFEFYARNAGDFISNSTLEDALNEAVLSERLAKANISETRLKELNKKIELDITKVSDKGEEKDEGGGIFGASIIIGLLIYITLTLYGQAIMGAIVEEKETRIAEILFSSAKPFELMMGKLTGVGIAGLTQLSIWLLSVAALLAFGLTSVKSTGFPISIPTITASTIIYFFIFFLLGFFTYATIYALIGSVVPTLQEGGNFSLYPILLMLVSFYSIFPVIRDPDSTFSFWVSVAPFLAPIVMPVRILAETPPFWQIALAILFNLLAIFGLTWVASRVYRVGMLMYGKRATIPEVWKWIRQT